MSKVYQDNPRFPGCFVSTDGDIVSFRKSKSGIPLIPRANKYGYLMVQVYRPDNSRRTITVHRLVMDTFTGDAEGKEINHLDRDKTNNKLSNLEFCTHQENSIHAYSHKRRFVASCRNGWQVQIDKEYLGYFSDKEEAYSVAYAHYLQKYGEKPW